MTKKSPIFNIVLPIFISINIVLFVATFYFFSLFKPLNLTRNSENIGFIIPKGQTINIIANRLFEKKLIRSPLAFKVIVKKDNLGDKIQAGTFTLSPNMSVSKIAHSLTNGTEDIWITIPEGWRREEIAESIARQNFPMFDKQEFLQLSKDSEGKLFPDTYLVPREISANQIFNLLTQTFERKVIQELKADIDNSAYSLENILVMASIVEREGREFNDLRYIAGILWNRIEIDMALQADATLQYAKGHDQSQDTWWPTAFSKDKNLNSPYNTYQNLGLPPTPISNPGIGAIKATINPIQSSFLYYLHDHNGKSHYAQTYSEHLSNINLYLQ